VSSKYGQVHGKMIICGRSEKCETYIRDSNVSFYLNEIPMIKTIQELTSIIRGPYPNRFYYSKEWKAVRLLALKRDHYNCKRCSGEWDSHIPIKRVAYKDAKYVHHIKPLKDHPELCLTLDNLVSLCFSCHEIVEERSKLFEHKVPLTQERW